MGCGSVWELLARMGGTRIWRAARMHGAERPVGCERHGGRIWSRGLTFFDASQRRPQSIGMVGHLNIWGVE